MIIFSLLMCLMLTFVTYQKNFKSRQTLLLNITLSILYTLVFFNSLQLSVYLFIHFSLFLILFFTSKKQTTFFILRLMSLYLFSFSLSFILSTYEMIFKDNFYLTLHSDSILSTLFFICAILLLFIFDTLIQKNMTQKHIDFILSTTTLPLSFLIILLQLLKKLAYLSVLIYTKHSYEVNLTLFIALLLELFFNIAVFKLLIKSYDFSVFKYQQKFLKMQYELESSYYEQLEKYQLNLRKIAHDIHHHQTIMRHYLEHEQYSQALDYLEDYTLQFQSSQLSQYTTHPVLNALLNKKNDQCQKQNIEFNIDIKIPKEIIISDFDLCILMGNLLDNALEAASRVESETPFIELQMHTLNEHLVIIVLNNFKQQPNKKNGKFKTIKADKLQHGLGLSNVEQVVNQYSGMLNFEVEQQCFSVTTLIPLS